MMNKEKDVTKDNDEEHNGNGDKTIVRGGRVFRKGSSEENIVEEAGGISPAGISTWDYEEGRLLSYFFNGDGSGVPNNNAQQFWDAMATGNISPGEIKYMNFPGAASLAASATGRGNRGSSGGMELNHLNHNEMEEKDSHIRPTETAPPHTPAVRFYSGASGSGGTAAQPWSGTSAATAAHSSTTTPIPTRVASSCSSSSSLSSAVHPKLSPTTTAATTQPVLSPIVPIDHAIAAPAPAPQTQMLPPPPRLPPPSQSQPQPAITATPNPQFSPQGEKQQHIAWLNQMNTVLAATRPTPGATPATQPMPYPYTSQPAPAIPQESEERRARRLARNRASARLSRRRKKELLQTLSQKVSDLHTELEKERRNHINRMEKDLSAQKDHLLTHKDLDLQALIRDLGCNSEEKRAVVNFQYDKLRQYILPLYNQFLLWLSLQPDSIFSNAKDDSTKMSGRVVSRQVGEKLIQSYKASTKSNGNKTDDSGAVKRPSCYANDPIVFWPYFCYEMGLNIEQEERFVRLCHSSETMDRTSITSTQTMITNLRRGMLYNCHYISQQAETTYGNILTPAQTMKFLQWFQENKQRCKAVLLQKNRNVKKKEVEESSKNATTSLNDLCRRLDEALNMDGWRDLDEVEKDENYKVLEDTEKREE